MSIPRCRWFLVIGLSPVPAVFRREALTCNYRPQGIDFAIPPFRARGFRIADNSGDSNYWSAPGFCTNQHRKLPTWVFAGPEKTETSIRTKSTATAVPTLRIADNLGDPNYWSAPTKTPRRNRGVSGTETRLEPRRGAGRSWRRNLHPRCPGQPGRRRRSRR